jgi:hypothetical protein
MTDHESPPPDILSDEDDPVLQMWGVGKELWEPEGGDAYIAAERAEMDRSMAKREAEIARLQELGAKRRRARRKR